MKALRILCLSHLAWTPGLFQRPQQLMTRFALRGHHVLYVGCVGTRRQTLPPCSLTNETLRTMHVPWSAWGGRFERTRREVSRLLIKRAVRQHLGKIDIVWYYHPQLTALNMVGNFIVYDVMDRFAAFQHGAAPSAAEAEKELLARADIVFTGGQSLHDATMRTIASAGLPVPPKGVHPYPSGVDLEHFAKAMEPLPIPLDIERLASPRLGYFGAVDERIDFELLLKIAAERPSWNIILLGPVLTAPTALPSNVHLMGPRAYSDLPAYLRSFDVCLMPFKNTELVAHISPTKTPEYLAGGKPVVSSPVPDVISGYGDIVKVADRPDDFLMACEVALHEPQSPGLLAGEAAARARTWDRIVDEMEQLLKAERCCREWPLR